MIAGLAAVWLLILVLQATAPAVPARGDTGASLTSEQILMVLESDTSTWARWIKSHALPSIESGLAGTPQPRSQRGVETRCG